MANSKKITCCFNCKDCPELGMKFADGENAIYWMYVCNEYGVNAEALPEIENNVMEELGVVQ